MPSASQRYCAEPGCSVLVSSGRCKVHRTQQDQRRGTRQQRGYTNAWLRYSKARLDEHPFCVGYPAGVHGTLPVLATMTDHILSAKDRPDLFNEPSNHQSVCAECNTRKANALEGGFGRWPTHRGDL